MTNEERLREAAEEAFKAFNTSDITDEQALALVYLGTALEATLPNGPDSGNASRGEKE